ncbi:hypothetical protein DN752_01000 [Echinicola strongylocentroti]|uniref:Response regulatory domain-containing protein n=1 Tax=Echinicola strongylocentroti TaxID=1795355 RepID=A0A2Z4ICU8_9BACT|nr:response regulator [Echinicola strongylocentroti]AWW28821.1 hypothetical protein DN752_01000 [Echinicola strongylocentroti]
MARIIILENDRSFSDNMLELLELEGHDLLEINEAAQIKHELHAFNPDLLIVDVFIDRKMSGPALISSLREGSDIPVLFIIDVYSQVTFSDQIKQISNCDSLTKPFKAKNLVKAVKHLLGLSK